MSNVVNKKILLLMPLALICALLTGIFLPVYSDEIMTKFSIARFFLEHGKILSFFPQCTTSVGHDVAWVFYPAAILISSIYAYLEPLGLRISGLLFSLIWFGLLAYWCFRQSEEKWVGRFTFLAAVASLGVMPYLLVLSRPEQFMLAPILLLCLSALYPPNQSSLLRQIATISAIILLSSVFFYAHPKSLFFTPFFFIAIWICTKNFKPIIRTLPLIYIILLSAQAIRDANILGLCNDAPMVKALLNINTLTPSTLLNDPVSFFSTASHNILEFPNRTLSHIIFNSTFQSGWLPPLTNNLSFLPWLNTLIYYALYGIIVGTHIAALLLGSTCLIRQKISKPILLASLLAGGNLVNILLFNLQNFYAGIQYILISIILIALSFHCTPNAPKNLAIVNFALRAMTLFAVALSLVSMATLFYLVTPNLVRNSNSENASIPGQPLSVPVFGVKAHLDSIHKLGDSCHIPPEPPAHLVVDHMTYFAYLKSKSPMHILYVSEFGYGGDLSNGKLLPFLRERNSPGLITRCEWIPKEFRSIQQQNDRGYCCVTF